MRRVYPSLAGCALAALVAASCGGDTAPAPETASAPSTPSASGNLPPVIDGLELEPSEPRTGVPISLAIRTRDPEGGKIDVQVDWYRNGQLAQQNGMQRLDTAGYRRGEQVHAVVRVSDGAQEVTKQTPSVRIANALPKVTRLELFPQNPTASDTLLVEAAAIDADGDSYELRYRWGVNGQLLEDVTGNSLPPNHTKRGDQLEVAVAAADSDGTGEWYEAAPLRMGNGVPKITSQPSRTLATATRYEYAIQASDPDGDRPLRYRMVQGPDGMQVDLVSGVVSWEVPETADGKFEVEIAVSDAFGGESRQAYSLEFHWQQPAAPETEQPRE